MQLEKLLELVPEYAKDIKINLGNVLAQEELTGQQAWGTLVACTMASGNRQVTQTALEEAPRHLHPQALHAAKTAAAVMGMNNIFYRFRHLSGNPKYGTLPARLRMQAIRTHGGDPVDFELWCLAVSAINGCAACVDAHEKAVLEKGLTEEAVLAAVRIASVVHGLAAVMDAEAAAPQFRTEVLN